jgi:hypothetical protein
MSLEKKSVSILICGDSEDSINTKKLLNENNILFREVASQYNPPALSLIVSGTKNVFRGYNAIEEYVNSLKKPKNSFSYSK